MVTIQLMFKSFLEREVVLENCYRPFIADVDTIFDANSDAVPILWPILINTLSLPFLEKKNCDIYIFLYFFDVGQCFVPLVLNFFSVHSLFVYSECPPFMGGLSGFMFQGSRVARGSIFSDEMGPKCDCNCII